MDNWGGPSFHANQIRALILLHCSFGFALSWNLLPRPIEFRERASSIVTSIKSRNALRNSFFAEGRKEEDCKHHDFIAPIRLHRGNAIVGWLAKMFFYNACWHRKNGQFHWNWTAFINVVKWKLTLSVGKVSSYYISVAKWKRTRIVEITNTHGNDGITHGVILSVR